MSGGRISLLCWVCAAPLLAQQYTHLSGLIQDPSGAAVPGALITAINEDTGFRRLARSGGDGGYAVASLQPGLYKITVRKDGFRTLVRFGIKLEAARPIQVDFTLPLGSMQEEITVTGALPLLNSEDAAAGALIGRDRIERLPLNGRSLLSLLELAPGAIVTPATRGESGQFTAGGQRPNANYFAIDGVSANSGVSAGGLPAQATGGALPAMTALGSFHGLVPLAALEEFRIQTSTTTSEFGHLPGAQVLLSSRAGSNEFHGSLFDYWRNGRLDAADWFANRYGQDVSGLRMNNFGASLGGPLQPNRTFFFLAYEGMRLREPFAWRAAVPSAEARLSPPSWVAPILAMFPEPNGASLGPHLAEWTGQYRRRARFDVASLRLDHALAARLTLFARWNEARSSNQFTTTQRNDLNLRHRSLTGGLNLRLGPGAVADLKLNRSWAHGRSLWQSMHSSEPGPCPLEPTAQFLFGGAIACDSLFRFSIAGLGPVASGAEPLQTQSQWHVLSVAELSRGRHRIRLGTDYRQHLPERRDAGASVSLIAETADDLLAARDLWVASAPARSLRYPLSELSVFAQDTWRLRPDLTATIGLRWEYAGAPRLVRPGEAGYSLLAYVFPGQTKIWRNSYANLAPRLAIAWRPAGHPWSVIRAGWGLYYHSTLSVGTDLVNGGPLSVAQFGRRRGVPFSTLLSFGFAPGLRLPAVHQWNFTLERALAGRQVISAGYVGSSGVRLLRREFGGVESTETLWLALATNRGRSAYHSLQIQYRKPMARNLQVLGAYSWSHSIDNNSSDSLLHWTRAGLPLTYDRGSSDFDARHSFALALSYEITAPGTSLWRRVSRGWGIDSIVRARSGFPITVLASEYAMGLGFANAFRPSLVAGQPVWLDDPSVPSGRRLNPAAFLVQPGTQGNLGRNAISGFPMHQVDAAVRRALLATERYSLLLRLDVFNVFNHPNFADPVRFLSSPLFGVAPSMLAQMLGTGSPASGLTPAFQTGGARSLQFSLRLSF